MDTIQDEHLWSCRLVPTPEAMPYLTWVNLYPDSVRKFPGLCMTDDGCIAEDEYVTSADGSYVVALRTLCRRLTGRGVRVDCASNEWMPYSEACRG